MYLRRDEGLGSVFWIKNPVTGACGTFAAGVPFVAPGAQPIGRGGCGFPRAPGCARPLTPCPTAYSSKAIGVHGLGAVGPAARAFMEGLGQRVPPPSNGGGRVAPGPGTFVTPAAPRVTSMGPSRFVPQTVPFVPLVPTAPPTLASPVVNCGRYTWTWAGRPGVDWRVGRAGGTWQFENVESIICDANTDEEVQACCNKLLPGKGYVGKPG